MADSNSDMVKDMKTGPPGQVLPDPAPQPAQVQVQVLPPPPPYPAQALPPQGYQQAGPPQGVMMQPMQVMPQQGHIIQAAPQPVQVVQMQQGAIIQTHATQIPAGTIVVCSGDLGDSPTMTTCRNCGQRVQTRVVYHSGLFAWLICGLCILFGLVFGCCVIPFFVDSCKDAHHFCTNCNANLCIHKKL